MHFLKALVLATLASVAPASAAALQKRATNVFIWGSTEFTDYTEYYTTTPGACQKITTPSSGKVGSATVDENASCKVYAKSDCSGSVAGTFSAPGISDTGSLGTNFKGVKCTIPASS